MKKSAIDPNMIRNMFNYNPESGVLSWKIKPTRGGVKIGDASGCLHSSGYLLTRCNGTALKTHRIIWAHFYGEDPKEKNIDHINGDRSDNRIANLRAADLFQNARNRAISKRNKTGFHGVSLFKNNLYRAVIFANNKQVHLGTFTSPEFAAEKYISAAEKLFGEFSSHLGAQNHQRV
jgi:HNH endonuclease